MRKSERSSEMREREKKCAGAAPSICISVIMWVGRPGRGFLIKFANSSINATALSAGADGRARVRKREREKTKVSRKRIPSNRGHQSFRIWRKRNLSYFRSDLHSRKRRIRANEARDCERSTSPQTERKTRLARVIRNNLNLRLRCVWI